MCHIQVQRVFSLLSGLWVGSFITIGFLVVPILFSNLGDREVAGIVAANLFKITAYIGVVICVLLMIVANYLMMKEHLQYRFLRWLLLVMLICTISTAFIIIPWMNSLRDQALFAGLSVRESSNAILFSRLHGVSSALFLVQTILGLLLLWRATKNAG
jgi:Mn2+/Fe2+ NRAMP family transporter